MTKEDYVRFKNNGQLDDIAFYYFKEMRLPEERDLDITEFKLLLKQFIDKFNGNFIQTSNGTKFIEVNQIKIKLLTHFDEKFK